MSIGTTKSKQRQMPNKHLYLNTEKLFHQGDIRQPAQPITNKARHLQKAFHQGDVHQPALPNPKKARCLLSICI